ncbi:hypothetical protein ACNPQK_08365 [Acinetobacter guillouiae]|uniref:hypothetical protein n=1 Tax=Acinetobacter guillouiae TaxID=106649 RepID=UPI003AF7AED0
MIEKLNITEIGPYKDDWAVVYVDPNNSYSAGGGRITVVTGDYVGSAFFSHVSQPTFKGFIAQCYPEYLIRKLFKVDQWIPVENGEEFIEYIARERLDAIKEHRSSGAVTKSALRELYDQLKTCEFTDTSHLYDILYKTERETMVTFFGQDWWFELNPSKINRAYTFLDSMLEDVIAEFKKINEVTS